jgi:hypothetical protein
MARANIKVMVGRNGSRIMVDTGDTVKVYSPEEFHSLKEKKAKAPAEKPTQTKTKLGSSKPAKPKVPKKVK